MNKTLAKLLVFTVAGVVSSLSLHGQEKNLTFESLPGDLAKSSFATVVQDSRGYLWIASFGNGLYKYDGSTATRYQYDPFDPFTISQNNIYSAFIDKKDTIWLGTTEGLCKFDTHTGTFTRFTTSLIPGMPDLGNVNGINEDDQGYLWVSNWTGNLWRFDRSKDEFLELTSKLNGEQKQASGFYEPINTIYRDRVGAIWVVTSRGLNRLNDSSSKNISFTYYELGPSSANRLRSNSIKNIFQDSKGMFWIVTMKGLSIFDDANEKFTPFLAEELSDLYSTYNIVEDKQGNLWFASDSGLIKLNPERTHVTTWLENPNDQFSLKSNQIFSLSLTDGDNLVISTTKGMQSAFLDQKAFGLLRHKAGDLNTLASYEVTNIAGDGSDDIWIGTFGAGMDQWNKKTNKITHYQNNPKNPNSLGSNYVNAILNDPGGDLWIGNMEYLSRLKKETGQFENFNSNSRNREEVDAKIIQSICRDKDGLIWLGTGNGIKSFDPRTKAFTHYYYDPGNPNGIIDYAALAIYADSRDNIWVGTGSIAFNRFDKKTGRFTHYMNNVMDSTSISSNIVYCVFEDSKHNLWIGTTSGGLCQYDYAHDKFITHTQGKGLPWNSVVSIQEDKAGNLWLGTENGLACYLVSQNKFITYDVKDGLQGNVFGAGWRGYGSSFRDKDGILYFGGSNGLTYFDPAAIQPNRYVPPVVITQFKIFDQLQPGKNEAKEIVLDYGQNVFSFEFAALNYTNSAKNQYAYQLKGFDPDWIYSGSRRYANYTNLDAGEYTFKAKGSNNDGIWNEEGVSIKVTILPPWWRTWWAYTFYGLCVAVGIFVVDRVQRRRLIAREREQAREKELAQAHEIEKAYHTLKQTQAQLIQSEKMASLGELTAGIAHEIQNPLNFVNNFSEVNSELITEMKDDLAKGNIEEARTIADHIDDNEKKIMLYGKRADAIVKGMLQHSRSSSGVKEPTDINVLADEYLRLSYHGLRAKDKTFNARLDTNYDETIGKINVIPQDIGRVILNLINNAFYAVSEKKKQQSGDYEPTVSVSTKINGENVLISVKDNGNGIPDSIKEKIFQPFFTTKPTGQGTGLGLSLSYDIVKAHGGELKVETPPDGQAGKVARPDDPVRRGDGAEFIIFLPLKELI